MMIRSGKCPGCGKVPQRIDLENIDVGVLLGSQYAGVSYVCPNPSCRTILGVGIDPVALKSDTVDQVVKALRGKG